MEKHGIDLSISFDTTGSMFPILANVRRQVDQVVRELFSKIEDIRISIIAHGDYCDKGNPYTIRILDFTEDIKKICDFVYDTAPTYGGDAPECYELVLNQARTTLNWKSGREKILMVIGDSNPHEPSYPENINKLDWKNEAGLLAESGVKIFAVHALSNYRLSSTNFYKQIANITDGIYLTLDDFNDIVGLIMTTCYSQVNETQLNDYVSIIRDSGYMTRGLANNINRLTGKETVIFNTKVYRELTGLLPVPSGRFQIINIKTISPLKVFLEDNGVEFKPGRTFYELKKTEDVQQYKEVILQDKKTGDLFYGPDVRKMLGLLPQCNRNDNYAHEKIKPDREGEYTVFIQSTSYNRKLPMNSHILYEIPDWNIE